MTQHLLRSFRLLAATVAVAAGIAGFALGDTAPAEATPTDLVLVGAR
ncbi:hypothetical protein GCU60_15335 [Blastococcus saxobsidens]|uniref:Uncharacterized protein n=1 Tax=Blastococcus saxobsidens TaxID=138336 RepID=A0A6L9W4Z2_9ACTN|nr:hypothetical protein [Blastococcus saxobsidens]NEK87113.1 hypothetical protein [Blastococcus saxobsidens]